MSDGNRGRSDDLQDYLDLLEAYSKKQENGYEVLREQDNKKIEQQEKVWDEKLSNSNENSAADFYEKVLEKHNEIEKRKKPDPKVVASDDMGGFFNDEDEEEPPKPSKKINIDYSILDENPEEENATVPPFTVTEEKPKGIKRFTNWYNNLPKGKKIAFTVISVILVLTIILITAVGIFVLNKVSLIKDAEELAKEENIIYEDPNYEDIEIDIGSSDFKQALIDWATTGNDKHMYSKNVINVLLIGADSRDGTNSGNTDVMMLLSLNKKTKQLKICSLFRDSYLYVEGKKSSYCTKLNSAYSMGGPECLLQTIENNYKIEIDNYVMVNFETFEKIIDEMGGVTVAEVKQYEADEIVRYSDGAISPPVGQNVTLDGAEALMFCRIRKCDADGDVSRTRRQRMVIDSIIDRVLSASISDINKYIDILLPYVETGFTNSKIISLGFSAVTGGWAKYEREQIQVPSEENRTSGDANMWIWVVDYQKAAHDLQIALYGQSNIIIKENRISIIDIYNGANYSGESDDIVENNVADEPEVTENTTVYQEPVTQTTTSAPTTEPTTAPTTEPTTQPTTAPTTAPTESPAEIIEDPTEPAGEGVE